MADKQTSMTPVREERRLGRRGSSALSDPFQIVQQLADEMDRMFDNVGLGMGRSRVPRWRGADAGIWAPDVDVFQKDDRLVIKADLPGLKRDEITVEADETTVTIQGERRAEREEEDEGVYRTERSYGSFSRVIPLPEGAISDQATAEFRDGVLEITMPAPPAATRGRRIEIGGEGRT